MIADGGDRLDIEPIEASYHGNTGFSVFLTNGASLGRFTDIGQGRESLQFPHDIAIGLDGKVYIADLYASRVLVADLSGTSCDTGM